MQKFLTKLTPFLLVGVAIVAFFLGIILLAYIFLFGAVVGLILYLIAFIRDKFFKSKNLTQTERKKGRIIDADHWKKM